MLKTLSLLLLFVLSACGPAPKHDPIITIDALPYVQRFETNWRAFYNDPSFRVTTDVQMGDDAPGVAGECDLYSDKPRVIVLDAEVWANLTDAGREQLVNHELGHCELGRQHVTTLRLDPNNCTIPASLMIPQMMWDWTYTLNRDQYIHELFFAGSWQ